jgi:hypothetical protein
MLVKDASQLVVENLAGLGAISRIISHPPSMSGLGSQPAHRGTTGQRLLSAAAAQAAPAIGQTRPSPGQLPASEHASPRCGRGFPGTDQPVQVGHACQACRRCTRYGRCRVCSLTAGRWFTRWASRPPGGRSGAEPGGALPGERHRAPRGPAVPGDPQGAVGG